MYKLIKNQISNTINAVDFISDKYRLSIPFDIANTDYQQFKIQVADGTLLEDPDGNVMTQAEVNTFLETLP